MFNSASAYQFRLSGPDARKGARAAILEQDDRMRYPMRRPAIELEERQGGGGRAKCGRRCKKAGGSCVTRLLLLVVFVALIAVLVAQYHPQLAQSAFTWAKSNLCTDAFAKALKWVGIR